MESQNIEYKQSWKDEYLKWICGFANAQGGTLYIGIDDNKNVVGVDNAKYLLDNLPNKCIQATGIVPDFENLTQKGKAYLAIHIKASDHLGSASWITDFGGVAVQHIQYLPYGEPYINQRLSGYNERFTFTGNDPRKGWRIPLNEIKYNEQRDEETGYGYFGARYMDHELMTMWISVDPLADKYPSISPYAYCAWNPMKLIDSDGREFEMDPYLIFNGLDKTLQIWDDNNTPDDYTDDYFIGEYNASNNVSLKDNPNGKWEDGVYPMLDKRSPHKHFEADGKTPKKEKGKTTLQDSKGGPYGEHGIFRAEAFTQDDKNYTEGRGVHAGRNVNDVTVLTSFTNGCIRTTPEAVEAIINAISVYGPLTNIIIQNNRNSTKSDKANNIIPGKVITLQTVTIRASHQ